LSGTNGIPREAISTAWYVRNAIAGMVVGARFTAAGVADLIAVGAKVTPQAASSALSDLGRIGVIKRVGRVDRAAVWEKVREPDEIPARRRRGVIPPAVQEDMPLPAPEPGAIVVESGALVTIRTKLAELTDHVYRLETAPTDPTKIPDAVFWAEAARRSALLK
jgi:hypothetical protein